MATAAVVRTVSGEMDKSVIVINRRGTATVFPAADMKTMPTCDNRDNRMFHSRRVSAPLVIVFVIQMETHGHTYLSHITRNFGTVIRACLKMAQGYGNAVVGKVGLPYLLPLGPQSTPSVRSHFPIWGTHSTQKSRRSNPERCGDGNNERTGNSLRSVSFHFLTKHIQMGCKQRS